MKLHPDKEMPQNLMMKSNHNIAKYRTKKRQSYLTWSHFEKSFIYNLKNQLNIYES